MIYLAVPIKHPDPAIVQSRVDAANQVLMVLALDGWKESVGVQAEISTAQKIGLEMVYFRDESRELRLDPDLIEYLKDSLR